jgi:hypothetical protein
MHDSTLPKLAYLYNSKVWMDSQTQEDPGNQFQETSEYRRSCSIQTLRWRRQRGRTMRRRKTRITGEREEVRWGLSGRFTKSQVGN